jgi:glycosyltransferase involved in cell wall biosynthesis
MAAYNEEKNIAAIIAQLQKMSYSIIVCNDGSSDMTGEIAEKMGATVINHKRNLGFGAALRSIFLKANELNADILVTIDADGQHNPLEIKDILKPIEDNEADVVIGSRFSGKTSKIPKYRIIGIKAINKLTSSSSENKLIDPLSGFRAYTKKVFKEILPADSGMGGSTEVLIKANQRKFRIVEIPILVNYEGDTSTHNPINQSFSLIFSTMKFISIERPLTFYGIPGIGLLILGLFFSIWTIQEFSITREIFLDLAMLSIGGILMGTILMVTAILLYTLVTVVRERK